MLLFVQLLSILGRQSEADVTAVRRRLKATAASLPLLFMAQPHSHVLLLVASLAFSFDLHCFDAHQLNMGPVSVRAYWRAQQDRVPGLRLALEEFGSGARNVQLWFVCFKRRFGLLTKCECLFWFLFFCIYVLFTLLVAAVDELTKPVPSFPEPPRAPV